MLWISAEPLLIIQYCIAKTMISLHEPGHHQLVEKPEVILLLCIIVHTTEGLILACSLAVATVSIEDWAHPFVWFRYHPSMVFLNFLQLVHLTRSGVSFARWTVLYECVFDGFTVLLTYVSYRQSVCSVWLLAYLPCGVLKRTQPQLDSLRWLFLCESSFFFCVLR